MAAAGLREGLVTRVDARQCDVAVGGQTVAATLRGRLFEEHGEDRSPVAVGDRVRLGTEGGELAIEEILPRRNVFARRASGAEVRRQLIAANVDQLLVVSSFGTPPFSSITADRILAAAHFHGVPAVLVLNKADLAAPGQLEAVRLTYERAGYPVLATSAADNTGIEALRECLRGRTSVVYGLSGAGKSTLLNIIEPGLGLRVQAVSRALRSGQHTTTFARMHALALGGAVIDTPGVRSFRPYGIPPWELRLHFPEIAAAGARCSMRACQHRDEPGCAVRAAVEGAALPESRYRSYLELLAELEQIYGGPGSSDR
ncbi:MAG: ribosome small subunit-dependent GTPase A [Planctomycetota bacterium]|nr:MAG: ribosome small subunit-dependent GTPase A [Planctomycetota bacterium]